MASDTKNVKLGVCTISFGGVDLGYTKGGVEVEVTTETKKVMVDQFGNSEINEYITGRTVKVKCPLAETTLDNMVNILPGATLIGSGVKASGTITITTNPVANDTVVVNGVTFTFVSTVTGTNQVLIGGTTNATAANLQAALNACPDDKVDIAVYTVATNIVTVTYETDGTAGNSFTLVKTGTGVTVSGATLAGGTAGSSKRVEVTNAVGTSLLSLAKELRLHPLANTDNTDDFVIPLAATAGAMNFAYKLDDERIFNTEFVGYPDPTTKLLFKVGTV